MSKLIQITDILETKIRKEKELAYYQKQLIEITSKIESLNYDLNLTQLIIDMIENDGIKDIQQYMIEKKGVQSNENEI